MSRFLKTDTREQLKYRRTSIRQISVARMTHFAGECFLSNLHLKPMKFGLFVKPRVSTKKLTITSSKLNFFDFRSRHQRCSVGKGILKKSRQFHKKIPVLESLLIKVADLFSSATLLKRDSNTGFFL